MRAGQAYFGEGSSEDDNFIDLAHLGEEMVDARTFYNIDVMCLGLDLDRNDVISRR